MLTNYESFTAYSTTYAPKVGAFIVTDNHDMGCVLAEGDDYCDNSYRGAEFRVDNTYIEAGVPINIKITGWRPRIRNCEPWVRILVEYVRDGEANITTGGFMMLDSRSEITS